MSSSSGRQRRYHRRYRYESDQTDAILKLLDLLFGLGLEAACPIRMDISNRPGKVDYIKSFVSRQGYRYR